MDEQRIRERVNRGEDNYEVVFSVKISTDLFRLVREEEAVEPVWVRREYSGSQEVDNLLDICQPQATLMKPLFWLGLFVKITNTTYNRIRNLTCAEPARCPSSLQVH